MTTFILVPRNAAVVQSRLATEPDVYFIHPYQQLNGHRADHLVMTCWPQTAKEWEWFAESVLPRLADAAITTAPTGETMSYDALFDLTARRR